jgi:hypothetical protein
LQKQNLSNEGWTDLELRETKTNTSLAKSRLDTPRLQAITKQCLQNIDDMWNCSVKKPCNVFPSTPYGILQ